MKWMKIPTAARPHVEVFPLLFVHCGCRIFGTSSLISCPNAGFIVNKHPKVVKLSLFFMMCSVGASHYCITWMMFWGAIYGRARKRNVGR